jgi:hypothetical protein
LNGKLEPGALFLEVQLVIPANAGIQSSAALDTGFRWCDGKKTA